MSLPSPSVAYRHLRTVLLLCSLFQSSTASTCDCITINSWTTLKSVAQAALSIGALGTRPHILLCPFKITKSHDEEPLQLSQQVFMQCMKQTDDEECVIESVGDDEDGSGRGRGEAIPMMELMADNVWVQGFKVQGAKGGAVVVGEAKRGVKLIDMMIVDNASPDNQEGAVVDAQWASLTQIIDCTFHRNRGTALQNRGTMIVTNSHFIDNVATPYFDSSDNIEEGSGVGGAIMNSPGASLVMSDCCLSGNTAETDGPAIWSAGTDGANVAEVGGTCAVDNAVTGLGADKSRNCNGVFDQEMSVCMNFNTCGPDVCTASTAKRRG